MNFLKKCKIVLLLIFFTPKIIQTALPAELSLNFQKDPECPKSMLPCKYDVQKESSRLGEPFKEELFNILAMLIEQWSMQSVLTSTVSEESIPKYTNIFSQDILKKLYSVFSATYFNYNAIDYKNIFKEIFFSELKDLIIIKKSASEIAKPEILEAELQPFVDRVTNIVEKKTAQLSLYDPVPAKLFAKKKEMKRIINSWGRTLLNPKVNKTFDMALCTALAEKIWESLEKTSNEYYVFINSAGEKVYLKQDEINTKKLELFEDALKCVWIEVVKDIEKECGANLLSKYLKREDFFAAYTLAVKQISAIELISSFKNVCYEKGTLPLFVKIKNLSATAFVLNLEDIKRKKDENFQKLQENEQKLQEKEENDLRITIEREADNSFKDQCFLAKNEIKKIKERNIAEQKFEKSSKIALLVQKFFQSKASEILVDSKIKILEVKVQFEKKQKEQQLVIDEEMVRNNAFNEEFEKIKKANGAYYLSLLTSLTRKKDSLRQETYCSGKKSKESTLDKLSKRETTQMDRSENQKPKLLLKAKKDSAVSDTVSKVQGIECHKNEPLPAPLPDVLKLVDSEEWFLCADGFRLRDFHNGWAQDEGGYWYFYNPETISWDAWYDPSELSK
ncbi:hypothetical protein KBB68_02455 [Candidatus Babeliales bacterium]|nr:hypothetical protein [Candidatus Babeliales bacterium]